MTANKLRPEGATNWIEKETCSHSGQRLQSAFGRAARAQVLQEEDPALLSDLTSGFPLFTFHQSLSSYFASTRSGETQTEQAAEAEAAFVR